MGSQGVTFPRGICMLIEDTGNPGTASRSQMKSPKVDERSGHSPQGPCWAGLVGSLILPVWMAAGLGFSPAAFTKKWFGVEQSNCVYPRRVHPGQGSVHSAQLRVPGPRASLSG